MSGANVMTQFVVYVFQMAGLTGNINLILSGVQYTLFIVFTTAVFFIDHTGRRPFLIYSLLGIGLCHFVVGGLLGNYGESVPKGVDGNLNVIIRVAGRAKPYRRRVLLSPHYHLRPNPRRCRMGLRPEVWSLETRAKGMGIAAVGNWLFTFALGLFAPPPAFRNITWKTFIIFGVLCLGGATQAFFTYPETAQKMLEEIEVLFSKEGSKPWRTKPGDPRLDGEIRQVIEAKERGFSVDESVQRVEQEVKV